MSLIPVPLIALLSLGAALSAAARPCAPVAPTPCPNCFAVFVMPDTQRYTRLSMQPEGANHLDLVTRYICANRTGWTEPRTGKRMPILMVIQLGDLVDRGDAGEDKAGPLAEWARVDAAFDNLDACDPVVPYLVTTGNHDLAYASYEAPSRGFDRYFGVERWTAQGYGCAGPAKCDWEAGEWFLGGGDPISPQSRNTASGSRKPGPPAEQPGRHRAARIRTPNGMPMLFLGLELAFDYPPAAGRDEGDDSAWPMRTLSLHRDAATVVFHHSMLWASAHPVPRLRWGPETWNSDSIPNPANPAVGGPPLGTAAGMKDVYDRVVAPFPQVRFLFTGHVLTPTRQGDYTIARTDGPPVWAFLRNYQDISPSAKHRKTTNASAVKAYGDGWNVIAAFDPDAGEVRVRSYRIDDVAAYADPPENLEHRGAPAPTACLDTDQGGVPERVLSWDFASGLHPAPGAVPAVD